MEWQDSNRIGGYPRYSYYGAPPAEENSPGLPYPPNAQAYFEYNQDEEEIDEDDEYYFEMQDAAEELERALAAGNGANFKQAKTDPEIPGISTPAPSTSAPTKQDLIKNEEKAAQLRAKLLEKRAGSTSRGPVPGTETSISKPPPIPKLSENTIDEILGPGSDVDKLVKEAREAAEAEATRNKLIHYDNRTVPGPMTSKNEGRVSPAGSILSASVASVAELTGALSKKAKKEAKRAKQQANRNGMAEESVISGVNPPASVAGKKNSTLSSGKATPNGKRMDTPTQETRISGTDTKTNGKSDRIQAKNGTGHISPNTIQPGETVVSIVTPSRSETLLSTSTILQDTINKSEQHLEEAMQSFEHMGHVTPATPKHDAVANSALALLQDAPKSVEFSSNLNGNVHKAEGKLRSTAAYSHHFDDLDEWLEITGYHDRPNREKVLGLYRRKAELERQMAEVERELEQTTVQRARSTRGQLISNNSKCSPVTSMPPPPTPTTGGATMIQQQSYNPSSVDTANAAAPVVATIKSTKRRRSPERELLPAGPQHADKSRRLSFVSNEAQVEAQALEMPLGSRRKEEAPRARSHSPLHARRASFSAREPSPPRYGYGRAAIPSKWNVYRSSPQEPNPPASEHFASYNTRSDSRLGRSGSSRGSRFSDGGSKGDSRYFMIKSWNHDNVHMSQRDGTWATQVQNEEILTEAFQTCRNVYLCFSVNKSMAFQGYARMESLPGTAPEPSWVKSLRWPCSPPFYIRWITIKETRFSKVGHLKNALNEMTAVLVGRDGQEIEENCGKELCLLIDEEKSRGGGVQY